MDVILGILQHYGTEAAIVAWVLWTNREREGRYIKIIQTLSEEVKERLTKIETNIQTVMKKK